MTKKSNSKIAVYTIIAAGFFISGGVAGESWALYKLSREAQVVPAYANHQEQQCDVDQNP